MPDSDLGEGQKTEAEARHLYVFLRTAIVFGALATGTAITVRALVRRHRVSPTAARGALIRLADDGLVSQEPGGDVVVSDGSPRS